MSRCGPFLPTSVWLFAHISSLKPSRTPRGSKSAPGLPHPRVCTCSSGALTRRWSSSSPSGGAARSPCCAWHPWCVLLQPRHSSASPTRGGKTPPPHKAVRVPSSFVSPAGCTLERQQVFPGHPLALWILTPEGYYPPPRPQAVRPQTYLGLFPENRSAQDGPPLQPLPRSCSQRRPLPKRRPATP